jgi:hypothetical protein
MRSPSHSFSQLAATQRYILFSPAELAGKMQQQMGQALGSKTTMRPFQPAVAQRSPLGRSLRSNIVAQAAQTSADPLLVRAARGEAVERAPCWMMRQAGRSVAAAVSVLLSSDQHHCGGHVYLETLHLRLQSSTTGIKSHTESSPRSIQASVRDQKQQS